MELKNEKLEGGVYDNFIVHINEQVSYCINFVKRNGSIDESDKIDSDGLILLLNAIAALLKINPNTNILNKGDEIVIGNYNIEFFRRYVKIDEETLKMTINFEFTY